MTILSTIIVLGVLIFVHELGHFLAARSVGIRVERFSIGLGPRIAGFTRGDTEYVLSVIPLGGYVKMGGMDDEMMEVIEGGKSKTADEDPEAPGSAVESPLEPSTPVAVASGQRERDPHGFDSKPVWARAWVISAGVIMNFLFAFVTYTVVAGGWGFPEMETTRIGVLDSSVVPAQARSLLDVPPGSAIVSVGGREVGHWGEVREAILDARDGPTTIAFEQPSLEIEVDLTGADVRAEVFGAMDYWLAPAIDIVTPGSPAEESGIQSGDLVVAVDDLEIATWPQLVEAVRSSPETEVTLTVDREGQRIAIPVTPAAEREPDPETGEPTTIGRIGIIPVLPAVAFSSMPPLQAIAVGWDETVFITGQILGFLRDLVTGEVSARNLGSIVAIGEMSGQAAAEGLPMFLRFMALFSVNLAILNLLPIPVLDGGHLVFLGIEGIRGHPLSVEQRLRWSQVGFVVLMGIMALALGNDLLRLFGL